MRRLALCLTMLASASLLADPPIGPGDYQNQTMADAAYKNAMNYRGKTLEYKTAATGLPNSCVAALASLQTDYNMRQYKQPPMTQAQKDTYNAKRTAALNDKYQCSQYWDWGNQYLTSGDALVDEGNWWYDDLYFYEAGRRYYWTYGAGAADWQDPNSWVEDNGGWFPIASLKFAQCATWHSACIQNCNEARAALSP